MNMLGYQATIDALKARGVPEERAVKFARGQWPDVAAQHDAAAEKRANVREKDEQAAIIKLLRERGFVVRSTSQSRPSKIAIGFPDLFVTHKTLPIAFFFESKRQVGGVVSEAQREFGDDCWRCGVRWYVGDRHEALRVCREFNVPEPR